MSCKIRTTRIHIVTYEAGMPPPIGGVDRGGKSRDFNLADMAAISGSWVSYIFTSLANLRTPKTKMKVWAIIIIYISSIVVYNVCMYLTFSLVVEAISFDNLLLDLCRDREHKLQHLAHVVAGTLPCLFHAGCILRHRECLDHLTEYHCNKRGGSLSGVPATADWTSTCGTIWQHSHLWPAQQ